MKQQRKQVKLLPLRKEIYEHILLYMGTYLWDGGRIFHSRRKED